MAHDEICSLDEIEVVERSVLDLSEVGIRGIEVVVARGPLLVEMVGNFVVDGGLGP